jgi:CheY-like chemotaxis protein
MAKVLLIEDDPLIFRLYKKLFTLEKFEIKLAKDGQEGLNALKQYKPDIILLDIMMPRMNGLEMLAQLKSGSKTKDIPVIVLTNIADMNVTNRAISAGAVQCIIKSQADPSEVISSVRGVLERDPESLEFKPIADTQDT